MGTDNSSTCCKDDVGSPTVAFIVGLILTCPPILVFLVGISAAGPRCIRDMARKIHHDKKEYSNLHITLYVVFCFGPALLFLGCFQVLNFDKVFYAMVVLCMVGVFCCIFVWLCWGLYVMWSFDRGDFPESLATRLIGDVDRLQADDLQAINVFRDLTGPTARAVVTGSSQVILIILYVWGLWLAKRPNFSDRRVYAFYILGMILGNLYLAGKEALIYSQLRSFNFWCRTFRAVRSSKHLITTMDGNVVEINWISLCFRWFLCTVVNSSGLAVVIAGLPLQLAQNRDPIDFVLNVVAAFYIIEIDNIDPIELKVVNQEEPRQNDDTTSGYQEPPGQNQPADSTSSDQPEPEQSDGTTSGDQVEQDQNENNVHVSPIQKWIRIKYRTVRTLTFALVRGDKSPDIEEGGPPVNEGEPPDDEGEAPVDQDGRNISSVVSKMAARLDANDAQVQELKIEVEELRRKLLLDAKKTD